MLEPTRCHSLDSKYTVFHNRASGLISLNYRDTIQFLFCHKPLRVLFDFLVVLREGPVSRIRCLLVILRSAGEIGLLFWVLVAVVFRVGLTT